MGEPGSEEPMDPEQVALLKIIAGAASGSGSVTGSSSAAESAVVAEAI